ncbi:MULTISPECIES: hypothetical protein [unclassified Methylophaga]|jgi:hypothetical protein|uniref:hypothetical protein n=1 Tax=unclassified Methylophaga TaxID=2629249 RepID=UPI00259D27DB|nr:MULTISPECIES: hypothetical protein [unclassified Methylophaga]|tara:strand:- start:14194 stop:14595 length:402 start_codon:yes stop_codon:yes gene_type:complete
MSVVESFTVGNTTYNVARASAVQQDEVLSILTAALIQRLVAAGENNIDADESVLFPMMMSLPFQVKQKFDELLMSRITISGREDFIGYKDFDGKVTDYNRLRAKVLKWNLEGFFTYWAEEKSAAIQAMQESQQ